MTIQYPTTAPVVDLRDNPDESDPYCLTDDFGCGYATVEDIGVQLAAWFEFALGRYPVGTKFYIVTSQPENAPLCVWYSGK